MIVEPEMEIRFSGGKKEHSEKAYQTDSKSYNAPVQCVVYNIKTFFQLQARCQVPV